MSEIKEKMLERFLKYVSFDTKSDENSEVCPSTDKQKVLGAALVEEMQAMGIAVWFLWSGVAELIARILMSKVFLQIIGTDALFIAEPASWLGALLCVMLPYFYYEKTLLKTE